jgi:hypothetical protein
MLHKQVTVRALAWERMDTILKVVDARGVHVGVLKFDFPVPPRIPKFRIYTTAVVFLDVPSL